MLVCTLLSECEQDPHYSEFNVEFTLYGTSRYPGQLIVVSSAGHSYHTLLLPSCAPSVSFFEQIPRLSDTDRGRGKKEGQRLGMKELPVFSDTERGGLLRLQMARDARFQHCLYCYLAHAHPTMFYIHLVLGLHTFQHSVGRRTNFTHTPPLPCTFSPTPSLSTSPSSLHITNLTLSFLSLRHSLLLHNTFPSLFSLQSLTTVPVCQECLQPDTVHSSDYWRLLYRLLEITGDYCRDYWRLL